MKPVKQLIENKLLKDSAHNVVMEVEKEDTDIVHFSAVYDLDYLIEMLQTIKKRYQPLKATTRNNKMDNRQIQLNFIKGKYSEDKIMLIRAISVNTKQVVPDMLNRYYAIAPRLCLDGEIGYFAEYDLSLKSKPAATIPI